MEDSSGIEHSGIQCDNPNCDWKDEKVPFEDLKNWLNVACPKCGWNLLTFEYYQNAQLVHSVLSTVAKMSPEEIEEALKNLDMEAIKNLPMFEGTEGKELLDSKEPVIASFSTHGGIKVESIKTLKNPQT